MSTTNANAGTCVVDISTFCIAAPEVLLAGTDEPAPLPAGKRRYRKPNGEPEKAPVTWEPYGILEQFDEEGNVKRVTTYDAFGRRIDQYSFGPRRVTKVFQRRSGASGQKITELILGEDGRRSLGNSGRFHPSHRRLGDLAIFEQESEQLLQSTESVRGCRRFVSLKLVNDERLDVLSTDRSDGHRHPSPIEELDQRVGRFDVGPDRVGREMSGTAGADERGDQRLQVAYDRDGLALHGSGG